MKFETLRNGLANFMGGVLPALVTLFTTPFIVNTLGESSYGVLTLITAIVGYFAFLDLNVTAGSVKYVAEHHATGNVLRRNQTLTSGMALYLIIGLAGCGLVLLFTDALLDSVFAIPAHLRGEAEQALVFAAFGFLFGQLQIYLNSVPQSIRRYDQSALLESIFGVLTPLAMVLTLWLGYGLVEIVAVRVLISVVNNAVLLGMIRRLLPDFVLVKPDQQTLIVLGKFSGFAYLSRLATVAYAQGDKLILGALTSMSALTHYAVPFMLVNRVFALSYRLGGVLFPVASALAANREIDRLRELYLYAARYVFFINVSLALMLTTLAHEILLYWIGPTLATGGAAVLTLITFASLIDSLTNAPSLVNDGLGQPHITGGFAVSRALLGVALTLLLVKEFGMMGAAWAQLVVSVLMTVLFLGYVHGRSVPVRLRDYVRVVVAPSLPILAIALGMVAIRLGSPPLPMSQTFLVLLVEGLALAAYAMIFIFRSADRRALLGRLRAPRPSV
ncbi:oligosaccharide flippase family protein [Thiobacillus sp.]|uniref:oligosaccharide flippase family protein n=1 Tax=Thiobacillus sp. TaxID=924 RepID=UPI0025E6C991|nr:oligosaccharide flippase family protein [Thiobacillus sp.]MBT9538265.1 oligosaccharide flippase family protein [Thiobacillus sp.]